MTEIFQEVVDDKKGDCMRATIASLLNLHDINMVPHFGLYDINKKTQQWWDIFYYFMYAFGYEYCGNAHHETRKPLDEDSIDGLFYVSVPSLRFKNKTHAVIMDKNYICVHDPGNSGYEKENIKDKLNYWYMFTKRKP